MPDAGAVSRTASARPNAGDAADGRLTIADAIAGLTVVLEAGQVPLARQEARDMIAALLDQPLFWPSLNGGATLAPDVHASAMRAAARRAQGAPFAYAVGRASFRHLTLDVDPRVLIPRQETEQLVELVLRRFPTKGGTVVDVGTGSGAIALALACEGKFERVIATDVSRDALAVARRNAALLEGALSAAFELREGSLLHPVRGTTVCAVVSNPPYIAFGEAAALPPSVRDWEPPLALLSGNEGMAATAMIIRDAAAVLEPGGMLALEVDTRRASLVAELAATDGRYRDVRVEMDLTGRERFVTASRA